MSKTDMSQEEIKASFTEPFCSITIKQNSCLLLSGPHTFTEQEQQQLIFFWESQFLTYKCPQIREFGYSPAVA